MIQVAVLLGFGHFVYHHLNLGSVPAIIQVSLILCIFATSLGLLVSFLSKNEQLTVGNTQIITMGGAVLGGLWFPIDILPAFIQKIAMFFSRILSSKAICHHHGSKWSTQDVLPSSYGTFF